MGYRGEDVPGSHGDRGRQPPWQPSSGAAPGNTGAWGGEPGGYAGGENYPPQDGGSGYGQDAGYAGQGYGPHDGQYGDPYAQQPYEQPQQPYQQPYEQQAYEQQPYPQQASYEQQPYEQQPSYEQQPYEQYNGYGPGQGQGGAGGYGGPQGYPQHEDYGYDQGQQPAQGYGQHPAQAYDQTAYSPGYDQGGGYDQRPAPGYGQGGGGGYQDPTAGYDQAAAYPASPAGTGGYPASPGGTSAYPASPAGTGGYPASRGGPGGYLALPSGQGGHSAEDAGNDWYGSQPAAANGASFADTGAYRLNGSVLDEYGTGPRGALRDPVRGFPPGPGQPGTGPQAFSRTGAPDVADTRQQERYDDRAGFADYGQDEPADGAGRGAGGGFQAPAGRDEFASPGGYAGPDGYGGPDDYATSAYGRYEGPAPAPAEPGGDAYNDYSDGFDGYGEGGDPYQDRYGDGNGPGGGRAAGGRGALGGKRLIIAALAVVAVGILGAAAYVFLLKPSSPASNANAQGPLPTAGAQPSQQACVKELGIYCHIQAATDDPKPLTVSELFPPAFTNEKDKASYSLVSTKEDKTCGNAVIGTTLIKALQAGKCTQVLRGSYVSGDSKIMGTIGVINLTTTNEAHYAGKDVGQDDFIAPLTSKTGVASKLGNGTGVVEAEFKGHYLILTWSEFVNGTNPTTKAQDNQLEQFSNDLVADTANIDLSQRMVTGAPASPAASASS